MYVGRFTSVVVEKILLQVKTLTKVSSSILFYIDCSRPREKNKIIANLFYYTKIIMSLNWTMTKAKSKIRHQLHLESTHTKLLIKKCKKFSNKYLKTEGTNPRKAKVE